MQATTVWWSSLCVLLATVAATSGASVGLGVDWTVSRGALRLLTNTPSSRPLTLPSSLIDFPAATLVGWGLGPGVIPATLTSDGSTATFLNVVSHGGSIKNGITPQSFSLIFKCIIPVIYSLSLPLPLPVSFSWQRFARSTTIMDFVVALMDTMEMGQSMWTEAPIGDCLD